MTAVGVTARAATLPRTELRVLRIHDNGVVGKGMDADDQRPVPAIELAAEADRDVEVFDAEPVPELMGVERDGPAGVWNERSPQRPPAQIGHGQVAAGVD